MLTLEQFDDALANRDLDTAYMDAGFRESIREAIMRRDTLYAQVDRMLQAIEPAATVKPKKPKKPKTHNQEYRRKKADEAAKEINSVISKKIQQNPGGIA